MGSYRTEDAMPEPNPPPITKMMLRIPEPLHTSIKIEAAKNRRSANAEVLDLLSEAYEPYQPETD